MPDRLYGPHSEADTPQTVTVYGSGRYPREEERPVPDAVLRQRRRINTIAHGVSLQSNTLSSKVGIHGVPVRPDPAVEPSSSPLGKSLNSAEVKAEPERTHVRST